MTKSKVARLVSIAKQVAESIPEFQAIQGPGAGDRATHKFMALVRTQATAILGEDFSEKRLCGDTAFAADFYFPDEQAIVEIALGLPNPLSEFEKDILKALMARDSGFPVSKLVFVSRAGAKKKCGQPGRTSVIDWAQRTHDLRIEVHELPGHPRRRIRRRRPNGDFKSAAAEPT